MKNAKSEKTNIDKEGNRYCFGYMPNHNGEFTICKFYYGKRGYAPLSHICPNEKQARKYAKELNEDMGLNDNDVLQIELSTLKLTD